MAYSSGLEYVCVFSEKHLYIHVCALSLMGVPFPSWVCPFPHGCALSFVGYALSFVGCALSFMGVPFPSWGVPFPSWGVPFPSWVCPFLHGCAFSFMVYLPAGLSGKEEAKIAEEDSGPASKQRAEGPSFSGGAWAWGGPVYHPQLLRRYRGDWGLGEKVVDEIR